MDVWQRVTWHHVASCALLVGGCTVATALGGGGADVPIARDEAPCFVAAAWPEADLLFRRDPRWLGGDAASSVDLGQGRILWLFGDSWVEPRGFGIRDSAHMISNSLAIQQGTNPASSSIRFFWGRAADGSPAAFIPDEGEERHWFGNGVMVDGRLVLFLNRLGSGDGALGFRHLGWTAWLVENPEEEPSVWVMRHLQTPTNPLGVLVGFAALRQVGGHVYALGAEEEHPAKPIHAARWPATAVAAGDLQSPEWWGGDGQGWVADRSDMPRRPIFDHGQSELSLHWDARTSQYLVVQSDGFGPADLMVRVAPTLTGPWSEVRHLYRPPEYARRDVMIYSAKAHPELTGADLVLTYATNSFRFEDHFTDTLIYYPRFVKLARCG